MQAPRFSQTGTAINRKRHGRILAKSVSVPVFDGAQTQPGPIVIPSSLIPLGMDITRYPSQIGKNILVTGCARGIGFNTARLLAGLGATVYMADIDEPGLAAAAETIRKEVIGSKVVVTPRLNLGSQQAVHDWCDSWLSGRGGPAPGTAGGAPPLHVLINNAGANFMGLEPWTTDQGVMGLPQVNFVGPYTLTRRLLPSLRSAGQARVVNLASVMHRFSTLPQDPTQFLQDWWVGGSYRNCKQANVVFTILLQQAAEQAQARGAPGLTVVAVDPGAVYSNIWATSRVFGRPPGSTLLQAMFSTPTDACATSVHAAAGQDVQGGQYWAKGIFAHDAIVKSTWEPGAGLLSCLDWPLRRVSTGQLAGRMAAVDIAPGALAAASDGRGVALWDAAADLAGLPRWTQGLDH